MRCKSVEQMAFAPDGTRLMVTQRDSPLADTHVNFLYLAPAVWGAGRQGLPCLLTPGVRQCRMRQ